MYAIANNGFIEGKQNEPLMQLMENFCRRAGLTWGGGVGIGGGVMLNVTRILYFVQVGMLVLNLLFNGISTGDFLPVGPLQSFLKNVLWLLYLNLGVLFYLIRMGRAVRKERRRGSGTPVSWSLPSSLSSSPTSSLKFFRSLKAGCSGDG